MSAFLYKALEVGAYCSFLCVSILHNPLYLEGIFFSKSLFFIFTSGLCFLLYGILLFANSSNGTVKLIKIDWLILGFICYTILNSYILGPKLENLTHNAHVKILTAGMYVIIRQLQNRQNLRIFSVVFLIIGVLHLIVATAQKFTIMPSFNEEFDISGMFFNPGPFCIYLCILGLFALASMLYVINFNSMVFYAGLLSVLAYFVILTFSRSAWIGLLLSSALMLLFYSKVNRLLKFLRRYRMAVFGLSSVLIPLSVISLYCLKEASADSRMYIWSIGLLIFKNNWLFGVGFENFDTAFFSVSQKINEVQAINVEYAITGDVRFAFNDLLQTSAEGGLVGIFLFISILVRLLRNIWIWKTAVANHDRYEFQLLGFCFASIILIIVSGLFSYPLFVLPINLLFWMLIAISNNILARTKVQYLP